MRGTLDLAATLSRGRTRLTLLAVGLWLTINLVLVGLFLWARDDYLLVEIAVAPTEVRATVNQVTFAVAPVTTGDGLGLYLAGATYPQPPSWLASTPLGQPLLWLFDWIADRNAPAGWTGLVLQRGEESRPLVVEGWEGTVWRPLGRPWRRDGPLLTTGTAGLLLYPGAGDEYRLRALLVRGQGPAGIVVRADAQGNGLLFLVRPEHRDASWWLLQSGRWVGPLAGGSFPRPDVAFVKDTLRLLLGNYFYGLALAGVVVGGGLLAGVVGRAPAVVGGSPPASAPARRRPLVPVAVAGIFLVSLLATGLIARLILEGIPHVQDDVAYLFQAKTFALGRLWVPLPPVPEFFEHEFIVMREGRWFSKYPPGHALFLALGVLAGAPWIVNPLAGSLALVMVYRLGRTLYDRATGLLAAALGLTSPFFLFLSGSMMAHPTTLLCLLVAIDGLVRAVRFRSLTSLWWAGAAWGLAFLVRPWTALVVIAPFLLWTFWRLPGSRARLLLWGVGALPLLAFYLWYNWQLAGHPLRSTLELWWSFDRLGFGPDHGPWGHTLGNALYNMGRNLAELSRHLFGWPPFFTFIFALALFASGRARAEDWLLLSGVLALIGGYLLWWADGIMYGPRFYFEALGFLLLLTARGAVELTRAGPALLQRWGLEAGSLWARRVSRALVGLVMVGLAALNLGLYLPEQVAAHHGYNYVSRRALDTVERAGVHHAIVLVDPGPPYAWWNYGMVFSANSPLLDTDVIYARDLGEAALPRLRQAFPDRAIYRLRGDQVVPVDGPRP